MQYILIADDNHDITDVLSAYARKDEFEPVIAHDGEEALRMFNQYNPAVVLLDVMMPKEDGYEVCRKIRAKSDTPVILITARGEDFEKIMGLDIGADDYIVKPFILPNLLARVEAVLRRCQWQKEAQPKAEKALNKDVNIEILTPKEKEVLALVAKGASNQDIADKLCVRDVTVKTHLNSVFKKLKVTNRTQAVLLAIEMNLVN